MSLGSQVSVVRITDFKGRPAEDLFNALSAAMQRAEFVRIENDDTVVAIGVSSGFVREAIVDGTAPIVSALPSKPELAE